MSGEGSIQLHQQEAILLILISLATLAGDVDQEMLTLRPVVDYEMREIEFDRKEIEHKLRMQQLQNESEQLKIEEQ